MYLCALSGSCHALGGNSQGISAAPGFGSYSYSWYVDPNEPFFPGSNFRIKVTDASNSSVYGYSGYFDVGIIATQGTLIPSTTFINYNVVEGSSNPTFVQITITNASNVPINYTLRVPNQPSWLNSSYATDVLPLSAWGVAGIGAAVDASRVGGPGTYTTNLVISGNFTGSPLSIPITLTVTAPPVQSQTTTQSSVSFSATPYQINLTSNSSGSTASSGWISFGVSPNQSVPWKATPSHPWISIPAIGTTQNTGGTGISYNPYSSSGNLAPGTYNGYITFSSNGSPSFSNQVVFVTLTIN